LTGEKETLIVRVDRRKRNINEIKNSILILNKNLTSDYSKNKIKIKNRHQKYIKVKFHNI